MSEWQPIETAPAGVFILTFADWDDVRPIGVSMFNYIERKFQKIESETYNKKGKRTILQEEVLTEKAWDGDHCEPTHWMPLPPPPEAKP